MLDVVYLDATRLCSSKTSQCCLVQTSALGLFKQVGLVSLLSSVPLIIKFFAVFVFFEFMDSKKTNKALLFCRAVSSHCFTDLNTKPDFYKILLEENINRAN